MPASEETGSGPVVHDHRRIDPVTGQVRGKHAASKPAGTRGAGRPGPATPGSKAGSGSGPGEDQPEEKLEERETAETPAESTEEAPEMVTGHVIKDGKQAASVETQLAERTADLQRIQAEYANYRKRVDRDRAVVREQAVVGTLTAVVNASASAIGISSLIVVGPVLLDRPSSLTSSDAPSGDRVRSRR